MSRGEFPWRQGDLLAGNIAAGPGLDGVGEEGSRYVLITHDCDLLHPSERFVELIRGRPLTEEEAGRTDCREARHPRKLHLQFSREDQSLSLELCFNDRVAVERERFLSLAWTDPGFDLSVGEKRALKQWLAARYGRPAFPNAFEERLRKEHRRKTVDRHIGALLAPISSFITGVFFDLGEERFAELPGGTPYDLSIFLVYDGEVEGPLARSSAEEAGRSLEDLFSTVYGPPSEAVEIRIDRIRAVADTDFSLSQIVRMDQWRLEYLSLGEEPENLLAAGHL